MNRQRLLELFVMNSMADDYERLEQIHSSVEQESSGCGVPFAASEVVETLRALVRDGFINVYDLVAKPASEIKTYTIRGEVKALDDQSQTVTIQQRVDVPWIEAPTVTYTVEDRSLSARLRIGESVVARVCNQYTNFWLDDVHAEDGKHYPWADPWVNVVDLHGLPDGAQIDSLYFGLSKSGRSIQDSEVPDYPFDDHGELRPGWALEE